MKMKNLILISLISIFPIISYSQFFGYQSAGYGYHKNPLYNYQKIGDQIKQTYTELTFRKDYEASQLGLSYISGLMIFNNFEARNYYEHKILSTYKIKNSKNDLSANPIKANHSIKNVTEQLETESEEENEDSLGIEAQELEEESTVDDSTDAYLDFGLLSSARHDKKVYKEFDNFGIDALTTFRFMLTDEYFFRISNSIGYRNYNNIRELSNISEKLSFQIGNKPNDSFNYGLNILTGYKFYTITVYDTSKFEPIRTFIEKKPGTGKPGAKLKIFSTKKILTQPQANGTWQIIPGIFAVKKFGSTTIEVVAHYYYNPKISVRYLAQYANTSMLTEDIYNDHFSYEGFQTKMRVKQIIFLNIQVLFDVEFHTKKFGAPALNLLGEKIATNRQDIRTSAEIYMSRYFNLTDGLGLDIYLSGSALRNQSNDHYNDFSLYSISGGIGIGF